MEDVKVYIWRVADNKLLHTYTGSNRSVLSLEWLPDRTDTVLCGSQGGYISMLRFTSAIARVAGFWAHDYPIERLAAKGVHLVSGAHSEVKIWKQVRHEEWEQIGELRGPSADVKTADEDMIVMGIHWTRTRVHASVVIITYMHHGIAIHNAYDWSRIQTIPFTHIAGSSISPDGTLIALSIMGHGFDLYDLDTGDCVASFPDQSNGLRTIPVLLVHGGHALLTGSTEGSATLWNVHNLHVHQTFATHPYRNILAIAANYNAEHDIFLLATGASNDAGEAIVSIWTAREDALESKPSKRWDLLAMTSVGLGIALAILVIGVFNDTN
ncbi:WD40-repeat-containing domain protein [Earliella scabrosa]|nr:WD40-repeat-containing domain protein [Earliella scabrosa]